MGSLGEGRVSPPSVLPVQDSWSNLFMWKGMFIVLFIYIYTFDIIFLTKRTDDGNCAFLWRLGQSHPKNEEGVTPVK